MMGKHLIDIGKEEQALGCFEEIDELEDEYDVQLLTDAEEGRIEELR